MMYGPALPAAAAVPPQVQALLPQEGADLTAAAGWQLTDMFGWLGKQAAAFAGEPLHFAAQLLFYLLLACLLGLICVNSGWKRCLDAVTVLGFGSMCLAAMMELVIQVGAAAQQCQTYLAAFVPVYSGILLLGGQNAGAAGYSGLFFSMSIFLSMAIDRLLLPIMRIYFCFAVSAALWGNPGIEEAANLFSRCLGWLLKAGGLLFGGVLGLQSIVSGTVDSAALRMGSSLLAGAIPIVGDAAAAALTGAVTSVHLLKGTLALALILTMGSAFAPIFLRCGLYYLAFSVAGIGAKGSGQSQCGHICHLFAEGTRLCGAIATLYFFMAFLSTALLLITGNGG